VDQGAKPGRFDRGIVAMSKAIWAHQVVERMRSGQSLTAHHFEMVHSLSHDILPNSTPHHHDGGFEPELRVELPPERDNDVEAPEKQPLTEPVCEERRVDQQEVIRDRESEHSSLFLSPKASNLGAGANAYQPETGVMADIALNQNRLPP